MTKRELHDKLKSMRRALRDIAAIAKPTPAYNDPDGWADMRQDLASVRERAQDELRRPS